MSKIEILAAGRMKSGPLAELCAEYKKRLQWPMKIREIEAKDAASERAKLYAALNDKAYVVALDERGKSLSSPAFAALIEKASNNGAPLVQFVIGGADGLGDDIRKRADMLLSFGAQTWPHMLARVMILEQIYRAQQISSGHPYHRA